MILPLLPRLPGLLRHFRRQPQAPEGEDEAVARVPRQVPRLQDVVARLQPELQSRNVERQFDERVRILRNLPESPR